MSDLQDREGRPRRDDLLDRYRTALQRIADQAAHVRAQPQHTTGSWGRWAELGDVAGRIADEALDRKAGA